MLRLGWLFLFVIKGLDFLLWATKVSFFWSWLDLFLQLISSSSFKKNVWVTHPLGSVYNPLYFYPGEARIKWVLWEDLRERDRKSQRVAWGIDVQKGSLSYKWRFWHWLVFNVADCVQGNLRGLFCFVLVF